MQSMFAPASQDAVALARFAWIACGGAALAFITVMVLLALALRRGGPAPGWRRTLAFAVLVPGSALAALFAYATWGDTPSGSPDGGAPSAAMQADALVIRVTARMWWWEVRYPGPGGGIALANELHVPAGRTVWLALDSADVIHTFWVPALAGKVDMVPGKVHHLPLAALRPGVWRGQCAEYCGLQHARMALHVVAQPPAQFDDWLARQAMPVAGEARHAAARALFVCRCAVCHTVRGVDAARVEGGPAGSDLTHVASRLALGAGALPNGPGAMAAWLAAPHRYKQGIRMPDPQLAAADVAALAAWLETLQ